MDTTNTALSEKSGLFEQGEVGKDLLQVNDVIPLPNEEFYNDQIWRSYDKLFGHHHNGLSASNAEQFKIVPPDVSAFADLFESWLATIKKSDTPAFNWFYPPASEVASFKTVAENAGFFGYYSLCTQRFQLDSARPLNLSRTGDVSLGELSQNSTPSFELFDLGLRPVFIVLPNEKPFPSDLSNLPYGSAELGIASRYFITLLKNFLMSQTNYSDSIVSSLVGGTYFAKQILQFIENGYITSLSGVHTLQDCERFLPSWFESIKEGGYQTYWENHFNYDPYGQYLSQSAFSHQGGVKIYETDAGQRFLAEVKEEQKKGKRYIGLISTSCSITCNPEIRNSYTD